MSLLRPALLGTAAVALLAAALGAHWRLTGFTVAGAKKGIMIDASPFVTIDGVEVRDIGDEGVHFRRSSSDGVLHDSRILNTGLAQPAYGEGVHLGSANSNWNCYGNSGGVLRGNTFDGPGIAGQNSADSWVDAKGSNYLIENNTGSFRYAGPRLTNIAVSPQLFTNWKVYLILGGSYGHHSSDLGEVPCWFVEL
jgi:hypothetical protein